MVQFRLLHGCKGKSTLPWEAAALRGAQVQWLQAGDTIPAGHTRWCLRRPSLDEDNENNNSVVLYLQAAEGSLLLMGDTEEGGEAEPADQCAIPYHGAEGWASGEVTHPARGFAFAQYVRRRRLFPPPTPRRARHAFLKVLRNFFGEVDGAVRVTDRGTPRRNTSTSRPLSSPKVV